MNHNDDRETELTPEVRRLLAHGGTMLVEIQSVVLFTASEEKTQPASAAATTAASSHTGGADNNINISCSAFRRGEDRCGGGEGPLR